MEEVRWHTELANDIGIYRFKQSAPTAAIFLASIIYSCVCVCVYISLSGVTLTGQIVTGLPWPSPMSQEVLWPWAYHTAGLHAEGLHSPLGLFLCSLCCWFPGYQRGSTTVYFPLYQVSVVYKCLFECNVLVSTVFTSGSLGASCPSLFYTWCTVAVDSLKFGGIYLTRLFTWFTCNWFTCVLDLLVYLIHL